MILNIMERMSSSKQFFREGSNTLEWSNGFNYLTSTNNNDWTYNYFPIHFFIISNWMSLNIFFLELLNLCELYVHTHPHLPSYTCRRCFLPLITQVMALHFLSGTMLSRNWINWKIVHPGETWSIANFQPFTLLVKINYLLVVE